LVQLETTPGQMAALQQHLAAAAWGLQGVLEQAVGGVSKCCMRSQCTL